MTGKIGELTDNVQQILDQGDGIRGLSIFVYDSSTQCREFLEKEMRIKIPEYKFKIVTSLGYDILLDQLKVKGEPVSAELHETQAITIPDSPFHILLDIEKCIREATGDKPAIAFVSFVIFAIFEELLHVTFFEWEHDQIHKEARLMAEKYLEYSLPDSLINRISSSI